MCFNPGRAPSEIKAICASNEERLRSSPFLLAPDEAPLSRLGLEESYVDGEDEVEDKMDKVQKIWRDMRLGSMVLEVRRALGK